MTKSYLPTSTEDNTDPDLFFGALERNPKVAAALGCLLGEVAVVEFLAARILALLLGDGVDTTRSGQILGPIQSIALRLEIIQNLAESTSLPERDKILSAVPQLKTLNSLRNEYAHALYETHQKTGKVIRTTWPTSTQRKGVTSELEATKIEADISTLRITYSNIVRDLFFDQLLPHTLP